MQNKYKSTRPLINAYMFRIFTYLIFLFTTLLYIVVVGFIYLQYTGGGDVIYTQEVTHLLIALVVIMFVLGWFFAYTLYIGIIKPIYETLNIIAEISSTLSKQTHIDKVQVDYLNDFVRNSLSQLTKSSLTKKINVSLTTESYIKKLGDLIKQNEYLTNSKEELSELVEKLEKQQKMLELEQAKTSAIIDSLPNGLLVTSRDGNIFLINKELEKILGIESENLLGKFVYNVLPDIKPINTYSIDDNGVVKDISNFNYKSSDRKKNIIIENTSRPIIMNKDMFGIVYILRDTTQEQATERAQREFVSLASHQLRTPITSIKWNSEIILSNESLDNEVKIAANDIYKESNRMEKLINSLLNLSKVDLGTIKFSTKEIYLDKYIEFLLSSLKPDIESKNIKVETNISFAGPIVNDPVYIDIVIGNIVANAVKYSLINGNIKVDIGKKDNNVFINISDTGIGIPVSQQSQIFSRLFRAENAKNLQPDGNGLGLYVVRQLVDLMNGSVWFESQENKGTTFFIELPIAIKK
jgi:two-component system sensor histidine kinase VicK